MKAKTRQRLAAMLLGTTLLGLAGGCAATPQLVAGPEATAAAPALDEARFQAVLDKVAATVEAADAKRDANLLVARVNGPALIQRRGDYTLVAGLEGSNLQGLPIKNAQALIISNSLAWPRYAMEVSQPTEAKSVYVFALAQAKAQADYALWGYTKLFPKVTIPQTLKPTVGSPQVDAKGEGLKYPPGKIAVTYANLLKNPGDTAISDQFDYSLDANLAAFNKRREEYNQAFRSVTGSTITFDIQPGPDGYVGLGTVDGGALVMTTLTYSLEVKSSRAINLPASAKGFVGEVKKAKSTMKEEHRVSILVYDPPADADKKLQVLGASDAIVGITVD